jgi:argininosuccinate lyase
MVSDLLRKGRLGSARKDVVEFTSSIKDDEKILKHVVDINKAHVVMLVEKKIISQSDGKKILGALAGLDKGMKLSPELEDVHVAVEEEVIKAVGDEVGGNLNLAKSRNDQVATAIRMNLREELLSLIEATLILQEALIHKSKETLGTIVPGYTHLQPAQPVTFAHYLLAQFDALERSLQRFEEAYSRVNLCSMGAGALATTSFPISREKVADLLGFDGVLENSLDAVSARDFLLEVLAVLSVLAVDVSRFVEDLIVWSTMEFGIIDLPDGFASTSSIMPQKKNPDVLEVIRARMSLILGDFVASAATLKGLPSAYNMDFQEVTPKLWGAIKTSKDAVEMLSKMLPKLKVRTNLLESPALSFLTSTELANMLVRKHDVPFRTAHKIVGALVRTLIEEGKSLKDATPDLLAKVSQEFLESPLKVKAIEVREAIEPSNFVKSHKAKGGPSPKSAENMLEKRKKFLAVSEKWVSEKKERLVDAERTLGSHVESWAIRGSFVKQQDLNPSFSTA